MPVGEETKAIIRETAFEVAEKVCMRYEKTGNQTVKSSFLEHELDCPGRKVGRFSLAIIAIASTVIGSVLGGMVMLVAGKIANGG